LAQALDKRHSTVTEALLAAAAMGAYRTVLTHFSQRYPKFPIGVPTTGSEANRVAVAFDGMSLPLALLPNLPKLNEAIACVLSDPEDPHAG
jgi:ribonuclease Z